MEAIFGLFGDIFRFRHRFGELLRGLAEQMEREGIRTRRIGDRRGRLFRTAVGGGEVRGVRGVQERPGARTFNSFGFLVTLLTVCAGGLFRTSVCYYAEYVLLCVYSSPRTKIGAIGDAADAQLRSDAADEATPRLLESRGLSTRDCLGGWGGFNGWVGGWVDGWISG